ncbi:hypothetical protein [Aeromicrobium sp. UC242_57]|uniref:hypothetical protein n=1 Tax=Aeromicrobium sp. UC242_57 TaxID=3374624 RepID=UPI00379185C2
MGVTVNAIAPRSSHPHDPDSFGTAKAVDEGAFDQRAPENVSPVVAWLAGPSAGHISGKVFATYGGTVELQSPIEAESEISVGDRQWGVEELAERANEPFVAGTPSGVLPLRAGIG